MRNMLELEKLSVSFSTPQGELHAVQEASLSLKQGEVLAVVGESGCGKSVMCRSILGLLPQAAAVTGRIRFGNEELTSWRERELQRIRGTKIGMIFQDPMSSLNPTMTIGAQIGEAVDRSQKLSKEQRERRVRELMETVGITHAAARAKLYPKDLSGGMRQRCVIAMALAPGPEVLIADEPTTALDVTVQAQILGLLQKICKERNTAILLVSHDLSVVAGVADRVAVMRDGYIVEEGGSGDVLNTPSHPYTRQLLDARRRALTRREKPEGKKAPDREILLDVCHLTRRFALTKKQALLALDDVSFQIRIGEVFGLVGESGSGKSTVARCVMNLCRPDEGKVLYRGIDVWNQKEFRVHHKMLQRERQMIFQDSSSSLNTRMSVGEIIQEPLRIQRMQTPRRTPQAEAKFQMRYVGLEESLWKRRPLELSGGQRQRVAIARALTMEPGLLVADEPVSSLDASTQAQIVELFRHLQEEHGFSFLFVAHDLALVRSLCDRVGVMYGGRLVEVAQTEELFTSPRHPYTKRLLAAMPALELPRSGEEGEG